MLEQSYTSTPAGSPQSGGGAASTKDGDYWELSKMRKCYTDFLFSKRLEIDEQIDARRYYHGSQYTAEQLRILKKRKQPAMTFNRIARKIDSVVGQIEKLRQDPKAYARTPQHAEGADLATSALRYVLDEQEWKSKSPQCASDGAVDGIGGMELLLTQGDQGDPEIGLEVVDGPSFFYDPRSYKDDFSDAGYMGIGKWLSLAKAEAMFPEADDGAFSGNDYELSNNSDREIRWFSSAGVGKRVRIIEIWYEHNGGWCYAIFSGTHILKQGRSYLKDEKKKEICKYVMFSGNVDQDGDRYGFVRSMKSAQDGINAKQSKMQHMIASKRIILSQGSVDDIEKTRAEWARPDGVVVTNRPVNEGVKLDDQSFDFAGMHKLLELNIQEMENFGPNHALTGDGGVEKNSGRAIALLQQAGMAELGPYILAYRGWKIRVYRAIWNAVQQHWKGERWVRVTDDQQVAQFIQINGLQMGPDGKPGIVNAVGSLDVDIILDEGPDHINSMADVYETLSNILPAIAPVLSPMKAALVVDTLIETSPLDAAIKKKFREQSQAEQQQPPTPDPAVEQAKVKAQIEAAKSQQDMELKQQSAMQDAQHKRDAAGVDLEVTRIKTEAEVEAMHQKNAATIQVERDKADIQMSMKKHEAEMHMGMKTHEAGLKHDEMKAKAGHEMSVTKDKAEKTDLGQIKAIVDTFSASLRDIAKTVETAVEKASEPKTIKVERDKSGRVVGATVDA